MVTGQQALQPLLQVTTLRQQRDKSLPLRPTALATGAALDHALPEGSCRSATCRSVRGGGVVVMATVSFLPGRETFRLVVHGAATTNTSDKAP